MHCKFVNACAACSIGISLSTTISFSHPLLLLLLPSQEISPRYVKFLALLSLHFPVFLSISYAKPLKPVDSFSN
ncbi:hypothetical protein DKX38_023660 [Salix brachista]|uniref:Uncharacterized protein n=1 Tax=Salix brachista TaxID=2182728 RepID=A0A5N5JJE4_9ROSI|nr:hypothetical protein DKX38_023660 [Salix brachista]